MKIDISTILVVIICVIPGLFAQRSRNFMCPRSFEDQGASAEFGELVAMGVSTHAVLVLLASLALLCWGMLHHFHLWLGFSRVDGWRVSEWVKDRPSESLLLATIYVLLSFFISHWLGFVYGIFRLRSPMTSFASRKFRFLRRLGLDDKLGERPFLWEMLLPIDENLLFLEIEMRDNAGFYAGQLSLFAIVRDEEPHKPVSLINVWRKDQRADEYQQIEADSVLLDLADAVEVRIIQRPADPEVTAQEQG